jgi:lipopolysaccharide transport system ATP-binding protein
LSNTVIFVDNLSKRYRLGLKEKQAETLAGQIGNLIKSPWQNLKRLRDMSRFRVEDESVFWSLKDINFEVKEGEVLGIIGKNGAGKSTLLKILSQITDPTSGKIEIHGRVASLLEVGTGFHPELSGRENIYMNGTILGMTRREINTKLDEIIDFSGVEKFIDTPVKFYSSGMKVRLGFSVAAHLEPEILIIDEVLAVGDFEFQAKCLGKMEDVAGQGRTVLFVSHNMQSVNSLCTRALILDNGILVFNGETKKAIDKYQFEKVDTKSDKGWALNKHPHKKDEEKGLVWACLYRNGKISDSFYTNDNFCVEFKFSDPDGIDNLIMGLVIKDNNGTPIIGVNNRDLGILLSKSRTHSGIIKFTIASLPIYGSGRFYIDLYFGDNGNNYDTLLNALSFQMIPTDLFNNGKLLNPNLNLMNPGIIDMQLTND